ncbi:(deoxy)nucleoside triphosphate pyrophosphohydrolase [Microbacterium aquimaris]|uniref:8-oxo-dGTP diphosphatase n=1 Tax=Microbacterium aquimaris TaxID=459816 RepID=A0ABU5N9N5_9MICO|nr:(deoxy)nucleoside triphosphate pyrophosphohydrolase [Microbacterium aquimaris]MDZ8162799.1 (deoxy)nucleoside triphosphate pyrophosphohydrolase [Microbacterium aquimaris]
MTSAADGVVLDVVAAVIDRGGRILACRRREDRSAGGRWEFPGGKIEPGETPAAALEREIAEELGVPIRVRGELTVDVTVVAGRGIRLRCLRAELVGAVPSHSTDHDELRWVAPADLPGLRWAEPDLPAVALLSTR